LERFHTSAQPLVSSSWPEKLELHKPVSHFVLGQRHDQCLTILNFTGRDTLTGIDLSTALSALHHLETIQITYGAIILSFLGALHWGMEFVAFGGSQGYKRLALGVVPVLAAWPTTFLTHGVSLGKQNLSEGLTYSLSDEISGMISRAMGCFYRNVAA
jgi:hypothetical protein